MKPSCDVCKYFKYKKGICKMSGDETTPDSYCDWFEDSGDFIDDDVFGDYLDFYEDEY